jgi:hypothetical protein
VIISKNKETKKIDLILYYLNKNNINNEKCLKIKSKNEHNLDEKITEK